MKILSSRNGVALVAVLTVLLVLTLLLPVMFRTSESATYTSVTELSRQKANYLARTGAEMAVATLKSTLYNENFTGFYEALKNENKEANSTYGITKNASGYLQVELEPISLYIKKNSDGDTTESKYISGTPTAEDNVGDYDFVGKTDVTIIYNGDPEYYKVEDTGYTKVDKNTATTAVTVNGTTTDDYREIKEGYIAIYNDNYMVKSTAVVNGQKATRSAAVMETRDMIDEEDNNKGFVAYTEQYWKLAPDFVKIIEGDYPQPKDGNTDKTYSYGGNHVLPNPFMASSKKTIQAFGGTMGSADISYYNKDVYIFSTIGNMHINVPDGREYVTVIDHSGEKGGNVQNYLALGAYPGLNWRIFENTKSEYITSLQGANYNAYSDTVQRYNFVSFCATDTLQVSLPIELRVNPKRSNRTGDHKIFNYEYNATLFKVMNFQAKDIVFDKRVDLYASICDQEFDGLSVKSDGDQVAYRGGFLNLTAPANTPYSYFNKQRDKSVTAGIVYFQQPVYLWFQNYDALGTDTMSKGHGNNGGETMFRTGILNGNTKFSKYINCASGLTEYIDRFGIQAATNLTDDLIVFKVFDEGDVYYFNAEIMAEITEGGVKKQSNVGVNIVNWYLETQYFAAKKNDSDSGSLWDKITNLKDYLYTSSISNLVSENSNYVADDMHYIGNMKDDPTLMAPDTEDQLYVVWDN